MQNLRLEYGEWKKGNPIVLIADGFATNCKKQFNIYAEHTNLVHVIYDETIAILHESIGRSFDKVAREKTLYSMLAKNILMLLYSNRLVKNERIHLVARSTGACVAISIVEQAMSYDIGLGEIWLQSTAAMDTAQKIKGPCHINLGWSRTDNNNKFENFYLVKEQLVTAGYMVLGNIYCDRTDGFIPRYINFAIRSILNRILVDRL